MRLSDTSTTSRPANRPRLLSASPEVVPPDGPAGYGPRQPGAWPRLYCFGKTDYRREADVVIVLGARAYADGRPSDALADRVQTGCALYRAGLVRRLLFSGGPGDGSFHETEVMQTLAVKLGVPTEAILVDRGGVNTKATVGNTVPLLRDLELRRVLVVSHFYHLPRLKLAYQRAGLEAYTVPAHESCTLSRLPFFMLREVAALWVYYLDPLAP